MKWRDQKPNYKPMKSIQIQRSRRASEEGQKKLKKLKKSKKLPKFKIKPNKKASCFVLLAVYVIYLVLGAVVFQALEHPNEVHWNRFFVIGNRPWTIQLKTPVHFYERPLLPMTVFR